MNKIFIEAQNEKTAEYYFLSTVLTAFCPGKEVKIICMGGIGNLFREAIVNQIRIAKDDGDQVLVLADADTVAKGYGYGKRQEEMNRGMFSKRISFPFFLYPNNRDDGEVEILMERAARRDLHRDFFDCFEKYEKCVSSVKDARGEPLYNIPNLKGKLHTYMNAQKMSGKLRDRLGRGDWLFDQQDYWDLGVEDLQPLRDFLQKNLR